MHNISYIDDSRHNLSINSKLSGLTDNIFINEKTLSLKEYIEKRKVPYGDKSLTHQWWDNQANVNFKIIDNEYEEFVEIYAKELKKEKKILHVMEQPKEIGQLCLDFDFKQISPERTICVDNIMQIISIVNNIIVKYYMIKNKSILDSYIFMKFEPFFDKKKLLYSDGFHLEYPNLILNVPDRYLIYDESRKEIIKQDLFSHVYSVLVNVKKFKNDIDSDGPDQDQDPDPNPDLNQDTNDIDIDDEINDYHRLGDKEKEKINDEIFDPSVIIKNKWFMYGSGKNINGDINVYQLEHIFDYNVDEIEDIPRTKELVKILSIRKKSNDENIINPKITEEYKNTIVNIKSKYFKKSYDKLNINTLFKSTNGDNQDKIESGTNDKIVKLMGQNQYGSNNHDDIQYAKKLVKMLNSKRASLYNDWISTGWALYNISPILLTEFIEFSKLDRKKFDENSCLKVWDDCSKRYEDSGYSIPSLVRWVKEDNIEGYKKLLREKMSSMLDKGDIKTDFDVACILKEMYKHDYKCSSIAKGVWWQFDNHRWNRIECAHSFSIKMSTDIAQEFANLHHDIMKVAVLEVGQKSDSLNRRCKDIQTLIFNLKKSAFKDRILKECAFLFYEKDFESKLDQNNYIIGFTNGVYDLRNRIFRKGSPDDFIGKTVSYAYKEFKSDDYLIKDIEKFIESIQPEKDMRDYLMVYCASFLEGSNKDQKFMIWTGNGMNGKGSLIDLLDNSFNGGSDGYFGTLPPTVLTQKRGSSSAATPELADKFGKRVITLQEPEGDDKIHVGFMKNITGQDKIEARPLYGDPFQYIPQFKLLLACNHLPNIPSDDGGTWRRIRVIDFGIKFTSNPQNKNERKSDSKLREKIKGWNQGFIWLLLNIYYPMYVDNEGLEKLEPERVKLSTNKYKADSNVIMEFFNEALEKDNESSILVNDIYEMFKGWYTNSYNDKKPLPRKKLIEYFETNNFDIVSNGKGICIKGIRGKDPSQVDISEFDNNL